MTTFSKRLKHLRGLNRLTQMQVGEALGVSAQAVQHWEKEDGVIPSGVKLEMLAKLLKTTPEYLIDGIGEPTKPISYNTLKEQRSHSLNTEIPILDLPTAAQQPREWLPSDAIGSAGTGLSHSNQAFAVIVPNNNMYNPSKDISFSRGDILLIEPKIKPIDGDFVFVCTDAQEHTSIIAQLQINPVTGERLLSLIGENNIAPLPFKIPETAFIVGTVIERKTRIIDEHSIKQRLK